MRHIRPAWLTRGACGGAPSQMQWMIALIAAGCFGAANAARAQDGGNECAPVDSAVAARLAAPDSGSTVWASLRPLDSAVTVPRWYLQVVLPEIARRFDAQGLRYDPLLDVDLRITVTASDGASAEAVPLRGRGAIITALWTAGAKPKRSHIPADPASPLARLAGAVSAAQHDSAIPPPPPTLGDSLDLLLVLRPDPLWADTTAVRMPLFRASGLRTSRARSALYDGEVDRRAKPYRHQAIPVWPRGYDDRKGAVVLQVVVDRKGRIEKDGLTTLEATPGFGPPVATAVKHWRFYPAMVRGCPEPTIFGIPVIYTDGR